MSLSKKCDRNLYDWSINRVGCGATRRKTKLPTPHACGPPLFAKCSPRSNVAAETVELQAFLSAHSTVRRRRAPVLLMVGIDRRQQVPHDREGCNVRSSGPFSGSGGSNVFCYADSTVENRVKHQRGRGVDFGPTGRTGISAGLRRNWLHRRSTLTTTSYFPKAAVLGNSGMGT